MSNTASKKYLDQNSHFSTTTITPHVRTTFDMSHGYKTTFNAGDLIPFYVEEVLPGDQVNMTTSLVCRLMTPINPIMDNIYLDTFYFYVENQELWSKWNNFLGVSESAWDSDYNLEVPCIDFSKSKTEGDHFLSLADYMDVHPDYNGHAIDLPFRAYCKIWNDWFRDENVQDEIYFDKDTASGTISDFDPDKPQFGGRLLKANKYHDVFTSCLPNTQRSDNAALLPLGNSARVYATNYQYSMSNSGYVDKYGNYGIAYGNGNFDKNDNKSYTMHLKSNVSVPDDHSKIETASLDSTESGASLVLHPLNLMTDLRNATSSNINDLRNAITLQHFYEISARGGNRLIELYESQFGVSLGDAYSHRSELLAYKHIPINISQVVQNSASSTTPLGTTGALSLTNNIDNSFNFSVPMHGFIVGVAVCRYKHSYAQGLRKMWSRTKLFDYYNPVFDNLGEAPIYKKEIYCLDDNSNEQVFGYNEAWVQYKYATDTVTGYMRPDVNGSLSSWHLADNYSEAPTLSSTWMLEDKSNIDRVIAVTSQLSHQFMIDMYFNAYFTRSMSAHSIPGIDKI